MTTFLRLTVNGNYKRTVSIADPGEDKTNDTVVSGKGMSEPAQLDLHIHSGQTVTIGPEEVDATELELETDEVDEPETDEVDEPDEPDDIDV